MRKKIISLSKKDFEIQTFKSGGKGGQHQNTTDSGVRIIHRESGARGESRNHRSQFQNKKEALKRLTESVKFKLWINRRVYEIQRGETIEEEVNSIMNKKEDFKIEIKQGKKWKEYTDEDICNYNV